MHTSLSSTPTLALACELIARPSVTPEDAGCLELIAARLAPLGFRLERIDSGGVCNLWARRGDSAPVLCFAGHTDVVPPGPDDRLVLAALRARRSATACSTAAAQPT